MVTVNASRSDLGYYNEIRHLCSQNSSIGVWLPAGGSTAIPQGEWAHAKQILQGTTIHFSSLHRGRSFAKRSLVNSLDLHNSLQ